MKKTVLMISDLNGMDQLNECVTDCSISFVGVYATWNAVYFYLQLSAGHLLLNFRSRKIKKNPFPKSRIVPLVTGSIADFNELTCRATFEAAGKSLP